MQLSLKNALDRALYLMAMISGTAILTAIIVAFYYNYFNEHLKPPRP